VAIVDPVTDGQADDPVWCHHCGTYTFAHEWGDSGIDSPSWDVCPVCSEVFPCMDGPLAPWASGLNRERAVRAARTREVVW